MTEIGPPRSTKICSDTTFSLFFFYYISLLNIHQDPPVHMLNNCDNLECITNKVGNEVYTKM